MRTPLTSGQRTALDGLIFSVLLVVILLWAFFVTGCGTSWRVFQKKVDGKAAETPAAQVEGQKRAAAYIRQRTAPPVQDPAVAVVDVQSVAVGLSASLGEPAKPVTLEDREAVIASLRAGLRAKEAQLDAWKAFGRKYAGTPLESTGIDLAGPAGFLGLLAIVAACIFIPGFGYVLLRALPLLWGFFRTTTKAIGEFVQDHPDAGENLKAKLSRNMDKAHKSLVRHKATATT